MNHYFFYTIDVLSGKVSEALISEQDYTLAIHEAIIQLDNDPLSQPVCYARNLRRASNNSNQSIISQICMVSLQPFGDVSDSWKLFHGYISDPEPQYPQ